MGKVFITGKYRGQTHDAVADLDPAWICVSYENANPHKIDRGLYLACSDECDERKAEEAER